MLKGNHDGGISMEEVKPDKEGPGLNWLINLMLIPGSSRIWPKPSIKGAKVNLKIRKDF